MQQMVLTCVDADFDFIVQLVVKTKTAEIIAGRKPKMSTSGEATSLNLAYKYDGDNQPARYCL